MASIVPMAAYDKSMTIIKEITYYMYIHVHVSHTHTHGWYLTIPVLAVSAIRLSSSAGNSSALSLMHPVRGGGGRGKVGIEVVHVFKQYTVYDGGL